MKLEIEVTEAEMKSALERHIRVAVADKVNNWSSAEFIKKQINLAWETTVVDLIKQELSNSEQLKSKIQASIESKLKGQINALLKGTK